MDLTLLTSVAVGVFGTTSAVTYYQLVKYKKQNMKLKDNEVKKSDGDVSRQELENEDSKIELGKKFIEYSQEVFDKLKDIGEQSQGGFAEIIKRVDKMEKKLKKIENEVTLQNEYLDGPYTEWKKNRKSEVHGMPKRRPMPMARPKRCRRSADNMSLQV